MTPRVAVYTAAGVATGTIAPAATLHDRLERGGSVELGDAAWLPLHGLPAHAGSGSSIAIDDVLLATDPGDSGEPVHAMWHPVLIDAGPYVVHGELPTMPGFDPGRALTRPSGSFLRLRDVRIELRGRPDAGGREHPSVYVNRYAVDRVRAGLMLGFFFPGSIIEEADDVEPVDHLTVEHVPVDPAVV